MNEASGAARTGPGYVAADSEAAVLKRLSRIEGQIRGVARMVGDDTYCIDVLTQVAAAGKAVDAAAVALLHDHLSHCVAHAVEHGEGADAKVAEASAAIARLVRS